MRVSKIGPSPNKTAYNNKKKENANKERRDKEQD